MKFLNTQLARSVWLFDIREVNPDGRDVVRDLVPWIAGSYQFSESPDPQRPYPDDVKKPGLVFKHGRFLIGEIFVAINQLTIYDDGIVIEAASSTEDANSFAINLLKGIGGEFGLSLEEDLVRTRLYVSNVIVRLDINLSKVNASLSTLAGSISEYAIDPNHAKSFELGGLSFWTDTNEAGKHAVVRIERQAGKAFAENRYFSDAPLQTKAHLALLERFEKMMLDQEEFGR